MRRPVAVLVVVGVAVLGGCREQAAAPPHSNPVIQTAPPQTTPPDPFAVPFPIDAEYVNRVLKALDQANADVLRLIMRTRTIAPEAVERLKSLYSSQRFLQLNLDNYQADLARNFSDYLPNPGNGLTTVTDLIIARSTCIFAKVHRDFSGIASTSPDPRLATQWVALIRGVAVDPFGFNPTNWKYEYDGVERGFVAPPNPCAAF